mmetsp:Transcript_11125/g.26735  ORF Transcript_11125/g.26735 Transcript_11125/m.26735 type:complete len:272 (-) Transcript_11125:109-924(-)|eukprot:CAMPEP_0197183972 /NCGR_PEP_ID=MMETSP1423-20130617/8903_1 /TAXON_ID=476441 /ORGANISM="Pseudo-nitzschia heimii, Strain UNC1101" /LENGTH=271 /DNA_ID=CAMNT_0042634661 /DNA_START=91 /DNA_END=906 /DNA_ORIENTATION=+
MGSPSTTTFVKLLLAFISVHRGQALDIVLGSVKCDESLPVYAFPEDVQMTCNNGESNRCSFGQDVLIEGSLQYNTLNRYTNGTGYVSANLRLLSVEYNLLEFYPINYCGDWINTNNDTDNGMPCPNWNGEHAFVIPYTLPWDDDDITTWFATGWSGVSSLQIRNGNTKGNTLLTDCTLKWHTYVTPSRQEGWKTMPSAAQAGIVLASVLTAFLCCCTYITCCRRRKRHVTDIGYYNAFSEYEVYDEEKPKKTGMDRKKSAATNEQISTTAE